MEWSYMVVLLAVSLGGPAGQTADGAEPARNAARPVPIRWTLNQPRDVGPCDDPSAYEACVDDYARHLAQTADGLTEQEAVPARLAAANWILTYQIEPVASRWFLGLATTGEIDRAAAAVRQAREHLDRIKRTPEKQDESTSTRPAAPPDTEASAQCETLDVFARSILAAWSRNASDGKEEDPDVAAAKLALLLEDERPDVAGAARLWRAALFAETGRRDRAMALLSRPLAPLAPDALRFDFYSRLYRCHCVADRGGNAVATALLLEIEAQAEEWFLEAEIQQEAARAAAAVRSHVLQDWCDSLVDPDRDAERQWCISALERIRTRTCEDAEPCKILRLGQAVPLLVDLPERPDHTSSPPATTKPAPQPDPAPTTAPTAA
jgi:hypothetical protein